MLGDLMGNMQDKQKVMQEQLATVEINETMDGLTITANGAREILNIDIDPALMEDKEQLEDLLVVTMNKIMERVAATEAEMSKKMISDLLPPGMEGLFGG